MVHSNVLRDTIVMMVGLQMRKKKKCIKDQMAVKQRRDQRDRGHAARQPFIREVRLGYRCDGGQQVGEHSAQ